MDTQNFQENIDYVPEIEERGNGGFYHRGAKAFPQSKISESEKVSQVFQYNGEDYLPARSSRNNSQRE
jgi:hypothetical protein